MQVSNIALAKETGRPLLWNSQLHQITLRSESILNLKVCKNSAAHGVFIKIYILDSDISNIIKPIFQCSNMSVYGLDLCGDKIQKFEVYILGYCLYLGKTDPKITSIFTNFLRSIDIPRSNYLDVRAIVNVIFIN